MATAVICQERVGSGEIGLDLERTGKIESATGAQHYPLLQLHPPHSLYKYKHTLTYNSIHNRSTLPFRPRPEKNATGAVAYIAFSRASSIATSKRTLLWTRKRHSSHGERRRESLALLAFVPFDGCAPQATVHKHNRLQPGARCWALTRVPELSIHMLLVQRKKMHAHPSMCLHEAISASRRIGENEGSDRMRFNMFRADTHMKVSSEKSSPPSIVNPTVRPFIAGTL
ncbi:uncharacterized protein CIMG_06232 [Coccidioides immitis RS]|uniref:Uncharacterized protein n=1 Tax=Coccidioides immitis (strain RS) TaxID=246410 RepID=J3K7Q6_COCIM|nr:uncharacterized protein CIMG_06232 [Coccidioides immitis RS]EAS30753.3 hypothetical protein CIMG_06232 [Coccidioides immitis RS]